MIFVGFVILIIRESAIGLGMHPGNGVRVKSGNDIATIAGVSRVFEMGKK